jgi:hypothetical protein
MWYDNDRKKQPQIKIEEAVERFIEKFGRQPTIVLTSLPADLAVPGLQVVQRATIGKDQFWIGEAEDLPTQPASSELVGVA